MSWLQRSFAALFSALNGNRALSGTEDIPNDEPASIERPDMKVPFVPYEDLRSKNKSKNRPLRGLEYGVSGTHLSGGTITGYDPEPLFYFWRHWAYMGNKMLHNETKLLGASNLLYNTLLSADWSFTQAQTGSKWDRPVFDYCCELFGLNGKPSRMMTSFEQQLEKFLPFILITLISIV